jgi:hypothetical protein
MKSWIGNLYFGRMLKSKEYHTKKKARNTYGFAMFAMLDVLKRPRNQGHFENWFGAIADGGGSAYFLL